MLKWLRGRRKARQAAEMEAVIARSKANELARAEQAEREQYEREQERQYQDTCRWVDRVADSFKIHELVKLPAIAVQAKEFGNEKVCRDLRIIRGGKDHLYPAGDWPVQHLVVTIVDTHLDDIEGKPRIENNMLVGMAPEADDPQEHVRAFADLDDPINTSRLHRNRQRRLVSDLLFLGIFLNQQLQVFGWRVTRISLVRQFQQISNVPTNNDILQIRVDDETAYVVQIPVHEVMTSTAETDSEAIDATAGV